MVSHRDHLISKINENQIQILLVIMKIYVKDILMHLTDTTNCTHSFRTHFSTSFTLPLNDFLITSFDH